MAYELPTKYIKFSISKVKLIFNVYLLSTLTMYEYVGENDE